MAYSAWGNLDVSLSLSMSACPHAGSPVVTYPPSPSKQCAGYNLTPSVVLLVISFRIVCLVGVLGPPWPCRGE